MTTEIGNAAVRIIESMQPDFNLIVHDECEHWAKFCDSPIEVMLGAAFMISVQAREKFEFRIVPQYKWKNYRSDFAIMQHGITVLIECDGHDFHERTKEQAVYDRQKDRAAQEAGFLILRFTGSEIYRDPSACALQIRKFMMQSHIHPQAARRNRAQHLARAQKKYPSGRN